MVVRINSILFIKHITHGCLINGKNNYYFHFKEKLEREKHRGVKYGRRKGERVFKKETVSMYYQKD